MTVNCDQLSENLQKGIQLLATYGLLKQSKTGVAVTATPASSTIVERTEQSIRISYDTLPHFYMALARALVMEPGTHTIVPQVQHHGIAGAIHHQAKLLHLRNNGMRSRLHN